MIGTWKLRQLGLLALILAWAPTANADDASLHASCVLDFPEAMALLQESVGERHYTVTRVQHVDRGLIERGYETAEFKVVFFGKPAQMADVVSNHPALIPFVPLSITISRDGDHIRVSALSPTQLSQLNLPPDTTELIHHWQQDLEHIVGRYARCDPND